MQNYFIPMSSPEQKIILFKMSCGEKVNTDSERDKEYSDIKRRQDVADTPQRSKVKALLFVLFKMSPLKNNPGKNIRPKFAATELLLI